LTGNASPQEQKLGAKFKKYLLRMTQVIEGTCKKIPSTPVSIFLNENFVTFKILNVEMTSSDIGQYVQNSSGDTSIKGGDGRNYDEHQHP
jgi:hypothetical protein